MASNFTETSMQAASHPRNTVARPVKSKAVAGNGITQAPDEGSSRIAHTLTACTRCRQRKTRCDPGLPRCGPCERTNFVCEYWDPSKGRNVNRDYVVYLQHRVRNLETQLEKLEKDEDHDDPEVLVRSGAGVKLGEADETKYLGPSSGTQMIRIVMLLAKQFTDSITIKDVVTESKARHAKAMYDAEASKPTSKIYPLTSDVAAEDLPNRGLTDLLVQLYNLKVQPMYPALHEPTFARDVATVYAGNGDDYQCFILRMVIAISLQKMDTQYAGLADSYYLAALKYLQPVIKPMDLKTLQAFALLAEYSLLTPTRTAIYYVMGLAVRLSQALGINEERTITRAKGGGQADCLEVDMRRRLFWCTWVMELGLAHSLGRPSILATGREHIDVAFFEAVPDEYITPEGILPGAPRPTLKKWIAIHFFKMRLLQLEIRRKLYLKKRSHPKDDQDPWFQQMNAKLEAWRDASPTNDDGSGLNKIWFIARYNTMIVMLFRPSPQVSRPTLAAAEKCFNACVYNIYVQREQITLGAIDMTWIFTQAIFMAINTVLWALSYAGIRKNHPKETVEKHLAAAMEAINICSARWPGVTSAISLYEDLIQAILKIYDKDGDIQLPEMTPSDTTSPHPSSEHPARSRTASPATMSSSSVATPPDRTVHSFHRPRNSVEQPPPMPYQASIATSPANQGQSPTNHRSSSGLTNQTGSYFESTTTSPAAYPMGSMSQQSPPINLFDPQSQFNPLPTNFMDYTAAGWNPAYVAAAQGSSPFTYDCNDRNGSSAASYGIAPSSQQYFTGSDPLAYTQDAADSLNPNIWAQDVMQFGNGLDMTQQMELMQSLETEGMQDIQQMITHTSRIWNPQGASHGSS
ncbi:hypothetical protein AAFC00_005424 [Neodothiora populina]|uniref:Zn(2)-C6 fungal-type domain-containing protein n=1 Tax=Neodothiora populina TaxID=2781224 RepID=A0ABR3PKT4_9PEZI